MNDFDSKLFDLCRQDDYDGLQAEFSRRARAYPLLVAALFRVSKQEALYEWDEARQLLRKLGEEDE